MPSKQAFLGKGAGLTFFVFYAIMDGYRVSNPLWVRSCDLGVFLLKKEKFETKIRTLPIQQPKLIKEIKMAQTKLEVMWEVVQSTVIPFVMGRFMGGGHKSPSPTTGDGGQPEAPLKQQTTSLLKPRNDEAIQLAVDAALRNLPGGKKHVENIQAVCGALEVHQLTSWREYLGAHELTERFENVMRSMIVTRPSQATNQNDPNQPAQGQQQRKQSGQEKIEMGFERRPLDYELTAKDPRVMHLVLVSKIVSTEATTELGVAKAKAYLLSRGLISKQSPTEKAAAAAKQAKDVTVRGLYQAVLEKPDQDEVQRREQIIERTKKPAARKRLERELEAYTVAQARVADTKAKGRLLTAFGWFVGILAFLFVIGLIVAASLKSN